MPTIELSAIQDCGAQRRTEMRPQTVLDYAEDMAAGAVFPPVVLYREGDTHWLADGFHRVEAARKLALDTIEADIRDGA